MEQEEEEGGKPQENAVGKAKESLFLLLEGVRATMAGLLGALAEPTLRSTLRLALPLPGGRGTTQTLPSPCGAETAAKTGDIAIY